MKTLQLFKYPTGIIATLSALAVFAFATVFVSAQIAPTITTSVHNGSHVGITTASIGTNVHANAFVASSTGPLATGTVDFSLYPNTTCAGTATVQSGVALVSGVAESATTTVGNDGLSYKVHYNGLTDVYPPTDSSCQALTATAAAVTLNMTLSTTTALVGTSAFASSTLNSATANATGTVAYNVYSNNTCTALNQSAGTKTVTNASVPNSDSIQFNATGTAYWLAVYSGDQNNSAATSSCQVLLINALPTTTTPVVVNPGTISGHVYNDANRSLVKDSGEAGLAGWKINLYTGNGWSKNGKRPPLLSVITDSNGNYSFTNVAPGKYSIEEINQIGWSQLTADYNNVVLATSSQITGKDFANATTTIKKNKDHKPDREILKRFNKRLKEIRKFWKQFERFENKMNKYDEDNDD